MNMRNAITIPRREATATKETTAFPQKVTLNMLELLMHNNMHESLEHV